jgi:hypothetical protein
MLLYACAPHAIPTGIEAATQQSTPLEITAISTTQVPTPIETMGPFTLELTPLPTATALPTLKLPPVPAFAAGMLFWDGLPTYPGESNSGFYFRLRFDPSAWALTADQFGSAVLASRGDPTCIIAPAAGRGLPSSGSVEHEVRRIGLVSFQVSTATINGMRQFVTYAGGDGNIYTAFVVSPGEQAEACLKEAEGVLGTLRSILVGEATPNAMP